MSEEARELYVKEKNEIEIRDNQAFAASARRGKVNLWLFSAVAAALTFIFALSLFLVGNVNLSGDIGFDSLGSFITEKAVMFGFGLPSGGGIQAPAGDTGTAEETDTLSEETTVRSDAETEPESEICTDGEATEENEIEYITENDTEDVTEEITEETTEGQSGAAGEEETYPKESGIPVVSADLSQAEKGNLYVINNTSQRPDVQTLADKGLDTGYIPNSPYPLVLVLHTHTGESYSTDGKYFERENGGLYSVAGIGETFGRVLNENGIVTVHCTVIHDGESNIDSYARAAETIETMLRMYPTIRYVIDLHRSSQVDEDGNVIRTLCRAGGVDTAQIGITVGMGGAWEDNLSLALKIRKFLGYEDAYLSRPVTLSGSKFNAGMSEYYLTVDIGSCGNTFEESQRAAEYLALALARVIKGQRS